MPGSCIVADHGHRVSVHFNLKKQLRTILPQSRQGRKSFTTKIRFTCLAHLVKTTISRILIQTLAFPWRLRVFAVEVLFQLRFLSSPSPHLLRQPTPNPTRGFTNAGFLTGKMGTPQISGCTHQAADQNIG
jgi:hypothetical protein